MPELIFNITLAICTMLIPIAFKISRKAGNQILLVVGPILIVSVCLRQNSANHIVANSNNVTNNSSVIGNNNTINAPIMGSGNTIENSTISGPVLVGNAAKLENVHVNIRSLNRNDLSEFEKNLRDMYDELQNFAEDKRHHQPEGKILQQKYNQQVMDEYRSKFSSRISDLTKIVCGLHLINYDQQQQLNHPQDIMAIYTVIEIVHEIFNSSALLESPPAMQEAPGALCE